MKFKEEPRHTEILKLQSEDHGAVYVYPDEVDGDTVLAIEHENNFTPDFSRSADSSQD